jgi:preprotein translocase subunit SecA
MAGRGTDIMLGGNPEMLFKQAEGEISDPEKLAKKIAEIKEKTESDKKIAIAAGGLYVLGSERHESRRIDNQLRGRSGRQGDQGKSKFLLSLEDDLMRIFGSEKLQSVLSTLGLKDDEAIFHPWITRTLAKAQQKVETRNYEVRKNLIKFDDIINYQRKNIFSLRAEIMDAATISEKIAKIKNEINEDIIGRYIPKNSYPEQWDLKTIELDIKRIYGINLDLKTEAEKENITEIELLDFINQKTSEPFKTKALTYGAEIFQQLERQIFLLTLDSEWKDHLLSLDKLRHGINLRAYAQKDPIIEYKKDAFNLFEDMMLRMEEQIISRLAHVEMNIDESSEGINLIASAPKQRMFETRNDPASQILQDSTTISPNSPIKNSVNPGDRSPNNQDSWGNVGRNELCPCNSGKKYKHCHG